MVVGYLGEALYYGLSSDTKPTIQVPTNAQFIETDTGSQFLFDGALWNPMGVGESNTASNVGSGGIGLVKQKVGTELQFRNLNVSSNRLAIALDVGNNEVDLDVTQANLDLEQIGGTITTRTKLPGPVVYDDEATNYGDVNQRFSSSRLRLKNPGGNFDYIFVASAIAADRQITWPLLTGNDTAVTQAFAQPLSNKTITTSVFDADQNTVTNIDDGNIKTAAGISYSKLTLTNSVVNADIAAAAGIVYSKLNLANSITNADIVGAAGIVYSKLSLTNSVVNADIAAGAAIIYSKLNLASSIVDGDIAGSGITTRSKLPAPVVYDDEANTFADLDQKFRSSRLKIRNPANSFEYSLVGSAIAANRDLTIPLLTANDTIVTQAFPQPLSNKTFDADLNTLTNIENADIKAAAGIDYSKLSLANSLVNADVNTSAAIGWSKISKTGSLLEEIGNLQITSPQNNQALTYDTTLGKWINEAVPAAAGMSAGGIATFSGDALIKVFNIAHGLGQIPDVVTIEEGTTDALGAKVVTKNSTHIIVTYQIAPPVGTNNVKLEWGAGFVGSFSAGAKSGFAAGGTIQKSGDGVTTVFTIAHGLVPQPESYFVQPQSSDARGSFITSVDVTDITITYPEPPPTGTNNLTYMWGAGYITEASAGFTPSSVSIMTNKSVGDKLTFVKVATPADQADVETGVFYFREIDANTNGLFIKLQLAGTIQEVQIAP